MTHAIILDVFHSHLIVLFDCIEGRQHPPESPVTVQVQSVNSLKLRLGKYLLPSLLSVNIASIVCRYYAPDSRVGRAQSIAS